MARILRSLQLFLLSVTLALSFIFIVLPACLFLFIYRFFVSLLAKALRKDLHKFVSGYSNILACDTLNSNPKFNLIAAMALSKPFDLTEFRAIFISRISNKLRKNSQELLYPELRQSRASFLFYYFWKWDRNYKIENHIREYDYEGDMELPASGCSEADVRRVMGKLLSAPWKKNRSPWELLLVRNYAGDMTSPDSDSKAILIFRLHHVLGDGFSFMKLILHDLIQVSENFPQLKLKEPTSKERLWTALTMPVVMPLYYAKIILDTSSRAGNPWRVKLNREGEKEYSVGISARISTDIIKEIKNKYGTNYNAVLLAATSRGVQRMMMANPSSNKAKSKLPKRLTCVIPFPLPNHPGGLVTHASMMPMQMPLQSTDFADCLQDIVGQTKEANLTAAGLGQMVLGRLMPCMPNFYIKLILKGLTSSPMAVSFFPGPEISPEFLGTRMDDIYIGCGLGPGETAGMTICFSANGFQRFILTIEKSICPNADEAQKFGEFVNEEIQGYLAHLQAPQSTNNAQSVINV